MSVNRELFQQIDNRLTDEPESHNQDTWEGTNAACGTTRCVAGWAVFLHDGPERLRYELNSSEGDVFDRARTVLGLSDSEANDLFYNFNNASAHEMVIAYAEGRRPEQF